MMAPGPDAPNNDTDASADEPQGPSMRRAPKKIYIPIRIQTNALNNDDIAINATYISIEDLAAARKKKKKTRDIEIRYLDSIRSFRDKIKSSYSCSQDHCPMIKERLDQHQMEHHQPENRQGTDPVLPRCCSRDRHSQAKLPTTELRQVSKGTLNKVISAETRIKKSVAISPAASILKRTSRYTESQSMQTPLKCVDFTHTAQNSFDSTHSRADRQTQYSHYARPISIDHDTTVTPKNSVLRGDLQEEIQKWFEDIPVYPSLTSSLKNLRRNMINEFIDKIFKLSNSDDTDYEGNVKIEVDNFLNALPMWYPGAKRDQNLLKEGIKNSLLKKIKSLRDKTNNKLRSVKYVDDMVNTDVNISLTNTSSGNQLDQEDKEKIIEIEVLDWLMQIKFKESEEIGRTINIIDATDIFTKRLMPLLDKPSANKSYKLILKGLIVDTLNDLPNVLHYPKNKRFYLNRIAEDLANRLITIQSKYKTYFNCCFPRERSMYQLAVCSKSSLKQTLLDGLSDCLQNINLDQSHDVKEEITDILIDCLESVRFKEDLEDKDELISHVLGNRSVEMSETQTSDITIENVRDILAGDIINAEYANKDIVRSCHSGTMSVFASEHEISSKYPVTSTPKQKRPVMQETGRLNKEEMAYMDKVGLLIRNWMETLPKKFDGEDEKSFKEVMINDLAGDVMDQLKLEQLAPKTTPDRDKFMFYIVFRWLFRFEVYEDLNDATPQIEDLVMRLHEIPVPTLTMPQRGNRQAMANIKHMEGERGWDDDFVPKSSDVLEDEISIWMNEQPSDIYSIKDKDYQNKMVHELAETVKNKIRNDQQDEKLDNDLAKWLKIMLKTSEKENIDKFCQNLKSRIMQLPKNGILENEDKIQQGNQSTITSNFSDAKAPVSETSNNKTISNSFNCKCPVGPKDSPTSGSDASQGDNYSTTVPKTRLTGKTESSGEKKSVATKMVGDKTPVQAKNTNSNTSSSSKDVKTSGSETSLNSKGSNKKQQYKKSRSNKSFTCECPEDATSGSETPKVSKSEDKKKQQQRKSRSSTTSICKCPKDGLTSGSETSKDVKLADKKTLCECPKDSLGSNISKDPKLAGKKHQKKSRSSTTSICECPKVANTSGSDACKDRKLADKNKQNLKKSRSNTTSICKCPKDASGSDTFKDPKLADKKKQGQKKSRSSTTSICECPKDSEMSNGSKQTDNKKQKHALNKKGRPSDCNCPKCSDSKSSDKKQHVKVEGKKPSSANTCKCASPPKDNPNTDVNNDKTLIELIGKYMEHNYDVDDSMTKGAFGEILKTQFRKLGSATMKEDDNLAKDQSHEEFSPERLGKELQYIKDISDWLKNIPIDGAFNTPHNKDRIEFVNNLAKNIYEVEENRRNEPSAMDYNSYLASIISQSTEQLPILPDHTRNVSLMVDQLVTKVVAGRTPMPCCMNSNETASSFNTTGIQEQDLSEFIDNYIRLNAGEIANDPVKLDAWTARVLKEAKKIVRDSSEPSASYKAQMYDKLANISIPEEESIRLFGLELDYAKEISEWLNNLPLLPITAPDTSEERVKLITELAEKFSDRERNKITNPSEVESDKEIEEYVTKWIQQIPLDPNREILKPMVIQQLMNRIDRVNKGPPETMDQSTNTPKKAKTKAKSKVSKTCRPSCCSSGGKAGQLVVEAIETWSNNLPVKAENKDAEKNIKDGVARKLFQKVGDLSIDPLVVNDDLLYQELLMDEVEQQLNLLPQSCDVQKKKDSLKKNIVDKVMEAKNLAKESAAGETYKQQLETTLDASIPNPVFNRKVLDPGFEIYKNRLAEMFILDNFDHGNDEVKLKFEKRIKKEIDKYYQDAQMRNALPLSKEQIYSELYSALFKIPIPCESSTAEEVEEVKTRCEIADWFEDLPLQEPSGGDEILKRDNIQTMLAKRLKEIEKKEQKPDEKIHKEITKWIVKLPLQPGNEDRIDELADDLQDKLKSTKEDRKRVPPSPLNSVGKKTSRAKGILGTSQIAGPSSAGHMWSSPPPSSQVCCQPPTLPQKKAADVILEIIENWCNSLPFYESTQKSRDMNKIIREDLGTKIIIKICELNGDPGTFSDDLLYNHFLDDELEKLMANLPICCDFQPTKNYKKEQLKEAINTVKPMIREERACQEYKKELNTTVSNVLKEPLDTTANKMALFNELREEIVDNFVQYHYNRDDDEGKQIYKAKLRDAVLKYFIDIQENPDEAGVDPLIRQNQLLCELTKISIPSERAIKDQVEEIKMKNEVKQFFEGLPFNEDPEKITATNNIKLSLAKRLNELEKTGHNCANDAKMKKEIKRFVNKLDVDVSAEKIESFVDSLKETEAARKASPVKKDDNNCNCPKDNNEDRNHLIRDNQLTSMNNSRSPRSSYNLRTKSKLCCPQAYNNARSLGVTPVEYQGFGGGVAISSSPQSNGQPQPQNTANVCPNRNQTPTSQSTPTDQGEGSGGRFTANKRKKQNASDNEGTEEECKCLAGKGKKKMKGRPRCVLRRSQFCEDCDEYGPMWMPMPPYRYPPGYFYY